MGLRNHSPGHFGGSVLLLIIGFASRHNHLGTGKPLPQQEDRVPCSKLIPPQSNALSAAVPSSWSERPRQAWWGLGLIKPHLILSRRLESWQKTLLYLIGIQLIATGAAPLLTTFLRNEFFSGYASKKPRLAKPSNVCLAVVPSNDLCFMPKTPTDLAGLTLKPLTSLSMSGSEY
ncbi:hypothetical protein BKA70DRAFT_460649 [Coprinopsis sp. MPI-PUGE-AT-0042]|nr:hypothetical protein BKA70DRAFT_460649 [Coprinopsis sp. MPI-PUGE-AT-0042]